MIRYLCASRLNVYSLSALYPGKWLGAFTLAPTRSTFVTLTYTISPLDLFIAIQYSLPAFTMYLYIRKLHSLIYFLVGMTTHLPLETVSTSFLFAT